MVGEENQSSGTQCTGGPRILHLFGAKRQKSISFNNVPDQAQKLLILLHDCLLYTNFQSST